MRKSFTLNGKEYLLEDTSLIRKQYLRYLNSYDHTIYDAYKNPSVDKRSAWEYCVAFCEKHRGYGLKVSGHNTSVFSAGFKFVDDNGNEIYCHITPTNNRYLLIKS